MKTKTFVPGAGFKSMQTAVAAMPNNLLPNLNVFSLLAPRGQVRQVGDCATLRAKGMSRVAIGDRLFTNAAHAAAHFGVPEVTILYWIRCGKARRAF